MFIEWYSNLRGVYTKAIVLREKDRTTYWLCIPDTIVQDKYMHIKLAPSHSLHTPQGKEGRDVLCQWPCQRSSRWPLTSGDQSSRKPNPDGRISVRSGTRNLSPRVFDTVVSSCISCCCFSLLPGMVWVGVGRSHYPHAVRSSIGNAMFYWACLSVDSYKGDFLPSCAV